MNGINLVTLLWTDGDSYIPCDYRIYNRASDKLFNSSLNTERTRFRTPFFAHRFAHV
ncbi:hypothetical protein CCP3SC5AM1_890005 [Gammaproteobacteria bacterium]